MKKRSEFVTMPRTVIESLAKEHPQLAVFIPHETSRRKLPHLTRNSIHTLEKELALHNQVLIRCSARSHWEPKVVPSRFYDVKLNYPMNNQEILKKAIAAAAEVRKSGHKHQEAVPA